VNGRRTETYHNTPEQVREYLRDALDAVADVDPPAELRVAAFAAAVNLVSSKSITVEQVGPLTGALAVPRGL
jgi:hypothetical protein